jgi:hypothetical protein
MRFSCGRFKTATNLSSMPDRRQAYNGRERSEPRLPLDKTWWKFGRELHA